MRYLEARRITELNKMQGVPANKSTTATPGHHTPEARLRKEVSHLARTLGVDLGEVVGTGLKGAVTLKDVQDAALKNRQPASDPEVVAPTSGMRSLSPAEVKASNPVASPSSDEGS